MFRFELKAFQVSQITAVTPKKTTPVVHSNHIYNHLDTETASRRTLWNRGLEVCVLEFLQKPATGMRLFGLNENQVFLR